MSFKPPVWIMTLAIVSLLAFDAQAQRFQPFIEADTFGPDLQFFAPAEIDTFGDGPAPKRGFYGGYSRLYLNVSRPKDAPPDNLGFPQIGDPGTFQSINGRFGSSEGDWTWGNRYDFGYMTVDDHGWGVSIMNVDGPNSYYTMPQLSRENFIGGTAGATTNGRAIYGLEQSLNSGNLSSFELNKIWRCPPLHSGTIFEPMAGIRYTKFTDHFRHDIFGKFETAAVGGYPDFLVPNEVGPWEVIRTRQAWYDNQMLGGQLGFRLYRQLGHWKLTADVRAFAFQNWQFLRIYEEQTAYNFAAIGTRGQWNETREAPIYRDNQEFVWGGEIRVEAAYELTRDISVRCGFMFLDFGKGMGRGGSLVTSDQDVLMTGISMGLTYNY